MLRKSLLTALSCLCLPLQTFAGAWSTCQSISAVTNYTAYSNTVMLILYPGIPGCSSDAAGAAMFRVGQMGVTADSLKGYLGSATAAYLSGKRVMIYYDESSSTCFSNALSIGGTLGDCN